jgi:hypothetical protein
MKPLFVTVIAWPVLARFRTWLPKASVPGLNDIADVAPIPVREAVCGLLLAPSVTVSVPVAVPVAVGVKETLIVQVPPFGASGCWQVFV